MWVEPEAVAQVVSVAPVGARREAPVVDMPVVAEAMRVVQAAQEEVVAEEGRWLSCVEPTFWQWQAVPEEEEEEATRALLQGWPARLDPTGRVGLLALLAQIAVPGMTAVVAVAVEEATHAEATGAL